MLTVLGGILATIFDSIATGFRKRALDIGKLSTGMFKFYAFIFGFFAVPLIIFLFGFDGFIVNNYIDLILIFIICIFGSLNTLLQLSIMKKSKLSELLPYDNIDKLFIIIIGFFIFYGTNNGSSLSTLFITILTLIIIILFTIDFRNLKVPKIIGLYIFHKSIKAGIVLATGYLLVKYSAVTMVSTTWLFEMIIFIIIGLIIRDSFKSLIKQEKKFYINRFVATIFGWTGWIISLIVLKEAGVVVATLLGFLSIVFMIFSMKFLLDDTPTKKQISLAFIVLVLIGIGYYFK